MRIVVCRRPGVDPARQGFHLGLDAPVRRRPHRDPAEEGVQRQLRSRCQLDLAQVDFDAAEPRQHRASAESPGPALQFDAVEDGDEAEFVGLFVSARGHRPPHERSGGHHPCPGAELEEEQPSKRTHRIEAYKAAMSVRSRTEASTDVRALVIRAAAAVAAIAIAAAGYAAFASSAAAADARGALSQQRELAERY